MYLRRRERDQWCQTTTILPRNIDVLSVSYARIQYSPITFFDCNRANEGNKQGLDASELQVGTGSTPNTSHIIHGLPLAVRPITDPEQYDRRASSRDRVDESLNFLSQNSPEDHQMLDPAEQDIIQSGLENTEEMDREEDRMELQTQLAAENQEPENSLSYQYGQQWGITEDVSTLDDILSLSW